MRISQRSIEEVREAANIVEIASEFTALKRQGARFGGLCPYPDHQEKTPSFSVSPDRNFYYCFGCLEANERIWTSRGLIPIAAAEPGDEVVGLNGRRETITDKWFKSGPTVRITTGAAKEGIELTPDHTCVYVTREEALRSISGVHRRSPSGKQLRFSRKLRRKDTGVRVAVGPASEVRPGDFWLYPVIPDEKRDDSPLPGERLINPYTKGPRTPRITGLPVEPNTAWLYGVWLAEGSLYRGGVKWSFGAHERHLAERVVRILDEKFGRSATVFSRPQRSLCEVACSSTDLSTLFRHWFGSGCEHKRIPFEALNWSRECQDALIDGYLDGDGHFARENTIAASVSEELSYGIFALCIQARRVCSSTSRESRTANDGVRRRKCYYVSVLSKESLKGFFTNIDGADYFVSVVQRVHEAREEPTTVVDITTTGTHTFLTKMGLTHNCQRGGDAIKLVTELKSLPFSEAVSYIAERSGIELQFEGGGDPEAAQRRNLRRRNIHKALAAAAAYYHKYLLKSASDEAEEARSYLKARKIDRSTIEEFRLGYAPRSGGAGLVRAAAKFDLDRKVLDSAGLLSARGGERFFGRVTFPISDRRGRIVGFGARTLGDAQPKYLNSPETEIFNKRDLLYGFPQVLEAIRRERAALVVEGYTDVLMLYQSGIKNAVATLGTATTPAHLRSLSAYADKIYVLFDPDAAGERALEKVDATARSLEGTDDVGNAGGDAAVEAARLKLDLRVLRLSKDPADWLLEHSADEFRTMLSSQAVPLLEYLFRRKAERARGAGATERSRMLPEIKSLIARIDDPVFHGEALRLAAETLGISQEALRGERGGPTAGVSARAQRPPQSAAPPRSPDPTPGAYGALGGAGRELLAAILARPELTREPLRRGVRVPHFSEPLMLLPEDFGTEAQARVFALIKDHVGAPNGLFADERARPFMDALMTLDAAAQRMRQDGLYSSETSIRELWLRLVILSRRRSQRETDDYDEKESLQAEIRSLEQALRAVSPNA